MTAAAHVYPNATQNIASKAEKWSATSDTLKVALIASGTYTWNGTSQAHQTVTDFLAGSGGGAMTEVAGGLGYSRTALASVTFTTTGLVSTLTCANLVWTATSNWSALYAVFFDCAVDTNDSTRELVAYWDFGGTVSVVTGGNFTLTINASGLVTYTAS
jgi:protein-L-isoaspartate O-methyltransferase